MSSWISSLAQPVKRTSSGKDASNRAPTDTRQGLKSSSVDVQLLYVADAEPTQEGFRQPCPPCHYPSADVWNALNVVVRHAKEYGSSHDEVTAWYKRAYDEASIFPDKRHRTSEASIQSSLSSTSAVSQNSMRSSATDYSYIMSPSEIRSATSMALIHGDYPPLPSFKGVEYPRPRAPSTSSDVVRRLTSKSPHVPPGPRIPRESFDTSPSDKDIDCLINQRHGKDDAEVPYTPPKFFCTHPDCKVNEDGFSTKDVWINHEKTIHESLEKYRCDQCDLSFPLRKRLRLHHKEAHNCTGASLATAKKSGANQKQFRCLHADDLRIKDLPQKGAWGCPYCAQSLPKWEARINHIVKEHYMTQQATKQDLSYTKEILGLLNQPYVSPSWSRAIQTLSWADIHWNNAPISKLKALKKDLEFATHHKSDPDNLVRTAFNCSSLGLQDRGLGLTFAEQADAHSFNGSHMTAISGPQKSLLDEVNDLADRHQRVDLLHSPIAPEAITPHRSTSRSLQKKKAHTDLNNDYSSPNSQEVIFPEGTNEPSEQSFFDDVPDPLRSMGVPASYQDGVDTAQDSDDWKDIDDILCHRN